MRTLLILSFILVLESCGTVRYTKVDPTNQDRFKHEQKISRGMDKESVLDLFGTPNEALKGQYYVVWRYYRAHHCGHDSAYCDVYFEDNTVANFYNFRMEYNDLVAY